MHSESMLSQDLVDLGDLDPMAIVYHKTSL
jgi:hypothetical protein